jgi:crotonobetainyl-CoA:carnitine CoA-transferase CaiB-like acyl-CoA transferase
MPQSENVEHANALGLTPGALNGLKVIDIATLFAGPLMATVLGDFGADVVKIEHPRGDPARTHGPSKNGEPLWWKSLARNKHCVSMYLGDPDAQRVFLDLIADADVFVENFRPGTLERWGIGPDVLHARNPRLVIARVTGFGQFGPMSQQAGFGTLAEAMSGFAAVTGQPDGPPTLPPLGLADGISALSLVGGVLMCLYHRDRPGGTGKGQVIDLAIIEPMLTILGPQAIVWDQLRELQPRTGNRSANNAPRNIYKCADGKWVAISTSANTIAERVMRLVGHAEVISEPWFASGGERAKNADLLDGMVASWIAERDQATVLSQFADAEAAVAPIYQMNDIFDDPQYQALGSIATVHDPVLGDVRMPNVLFRLSDTPGTIRWPGRALGADTEAILRDRAGVSNEQLEALRAKGVI